MTQHRKPAWRIRHPLSVLEPISVRPASKHRGMERYDGSEGNDSAKQKPVDQVTVHVFAS